MSKPKRPRDINQLASIITGLSTGALKEPKSTKNPANVEMGRIGGLKGGKVRAEKLTPEKKSTIARQAALARWNKGQS